MHGLIRNKAIFFSFLSNIFCLFTVTKHVLELKGAIDYMKSFIARHFQRSWLSSFNCAIRQIPNLCRRGNIDQKRSECYGIYLFIFCLTSFLNQTKLRNCLWIVIIICSFLFPRRSSDHTLGANMKTLANAVCLMAYLWPQDLRIRAKISIAKTIFTSKNIKN